MARTSEDEVISDDNEAVLAPSAAEVETKVVFGDNGNDLQSLSEVIQKLPSHVLKDLLSIGVCIRCIFRLFGIRGDVYSFSSLSTSILGSFEDQTDLDNKNTYNSPDCKESQLEQLICGLCLGILQFTYSDGKEKLAKYENADEFAVSIAEVVKKEGFQIDSFSLEVSVPAFLLQNEHAIWLFLKGKYGFEPWFQENSVSSCFSSKDALKMSITKPLEQLLGCKSGISAFHIRLTYNHNKASNVAACSIEKEHVLKRRKTEINNSDAVDNSIASGIKCDISMREGEAVIKGCSNNLQATESSRCCKFPVQINEPCHLAVLCSRTPIYFIGRYLKYSRNVSQTRWIIDDERMGETSVEEILGSSILPLCHGDNYKFHAAGREDIDVRMLGSGRPFLVEIQNARCIPSEMAVKEVETKINNSEKKLVGVKNLKVVGSEGWALMREGEAEKQKQYAALVWTSRPIEDKDFDSISSLKDIQIAQRTPIRVLHRRSPLDREKIIHWMKTEKVAGSSQYFLLHLCTQAGTYIKEFVHGDLGRTHPSVGSILGCRAEILQLDVTDVKMDCFPTE